MSVSVDVDMAGSTAHKLECPPTPVVHRKRNLPEPGHTPKHLPRELVAGYLPSAPPSLPPRLKRAFDNELILQCHRKRTYIFKFRGLVLRTFTEAQHAIAGDGDILPMRPSRVMIQSGSDLTTDDPRFRALEAQLARLDVKRKRVAFEELTEEIPRLRGEHIDSKDRRRAKRVRVRREEVDVEARWVAEVGSSVVGKGKQRADWPLDGTAGGGWPRFW